MSVESTSQKFCQFRVYSSADDQNNSPSSGTKPCGELATYTVTYRLDAHDGTETDYACDFHHAYLTIEDETVVWSKSKKIEQTFNGAVANKSS